jgi:hypothetical protein
MKAVYRVQGQPEIPTPVNSIQFENQKELFNTLGFCASEPRGILNSKWRETKEKAKIQPLTAIDSRSLFQEQLWNSRTIEKGSAQNGSGTIFL